MHRALVQERHQDWAARFGPLGLTVTELSGDSDAEARELEGADLICTTPEKFGGGAGRRWVLVGASLGRPVQGRAACMDLVGTY
jgi:replicative superfamily II helicase